MLIRDMHDGYLALQVVDLGGLENWSELRKMQTEAAELIRRYDRAATRVQMLEGSRESVRGRDIAAHAKAIRSGSKVPKPKHEAELDSEIEEATRERDALHLAASEAIGEHNLYVAERGREIYADVLRHQAGIAEQLREAAVKASQLFGALRNSQDEAKRLLPPEPDPFLEDVPAGQSQIVMGIATTGNDEPARGDVEGMLAYLASIAERYEATEPEASPVEATG